MRPLLYFSYGMTKTGSTLAFELVRTALDLSGFPQDRLEMEAILDSSSINFVRRLTDSQLTSLSDEAKRRGYPIVLKTHSRPTRALINMILSGEALADASYRDPRDMVLSMLDHGNRARKNGQKSFSNLYTSEDTLENIRHQHNTLTAWLRIPGTLPLYFEDVAFETAAIAKTILERLDLKLDPAVLADVVLSQRFTQKNKAVRLRYPNEMNRKLSSEIEAEFAPLFEKLVSNRHQTYARNHVYLPAPEQLRTSIPD